MHVCLFQKHVFIQNSKHAKRALRDNIWIQAPFPRMLVLPVDVFFSP